MVRVDAVGVEPTSPIAVRIVFQFPPIPFGSVKEPTDAITPIVYAIDIRSSSAWLVTNYSHDSGRISV